MSIIDNGDEEHLIEVKQNGEITGHGQDICADDPRQRTGNENERVEQARRFARYYVYKERGYDTAHPQYHPERLDAVRTVLQNLSDERARDLLGDLYQQMASYHDDTPRAMAIPREAPGADHMLYRTDIYLGVDLLDSEVSAVAEDIAAAHDVDLSKEDHAVDHQSQSVLDRWEAFTDDLRETLVDRDVDLSGETYVDAASPLYASYIDGGDYEVLGPETDPLDREPDATLELAPVDPGDFEQFRAFVDHHLKCQIRDSYVRMGLQPPEQFRVIGSGRLESVVAYRFLDMYPRYDDPDVLDTI
ncbi:hypothetical protein RYH80_12105 [Halobaculum sp. MBLA0147]|uniref:hypothetical protein n=1 Tax=Halobaculum sp. MBLA0147 TaxID=3079934 RepID=UPI0035231B26